MLRLVLKDIIIQKRYLMLGVVYSLVFGICFSSMPDSMYIMGGTAVAYMFILGAVGYDEKNKSEVILNSLPIKRNAIVYSKYISSLIFIVFGTLLCGVGGAFVKLIGIPFVKRYVGLNDFISVFVAIAFLCAIYFPVYFKYGYHKAKYFNMIMFLLVFFIPTFVVSYIKESMTKERAIEMVKFFESRPETIIIFMTSIVIIMLMISMAISLRVYRKREF